MTTRSAKPTRGARTARLALALGALSLGLSGCSETTEAAPPAPIDPMLAYADKPFIHRSELITPKPASPFRLVDQDGESFGLDDLQGKVALVGFIYTSCPDICRAITTTYLDMQKEFAQQVGSDLGLVLITTDPETDTPEQMKEYTEKFGGNWTFLTGTADELSEVYASYKVTVDQRKGAKKNSHSWMVVLIDRRSKIRYRYIGQDVPKDVLVADIRALLLEDKP